MIRMVITLVGIILLAGSAMADDIDLPAPFPDQPQIYHLLKARASVLLNEDFNTSAISMNDASSILWAASGLNRQGRGWVVPVAYGNLPSPYWRVYVLHKTGLYLYDWKGHRLQHINDLDIRGRIFTQPQPATASLVLVFVQDGNVLDDIKAVTSNRYANCDLGAMAMGAISQNVYLAAAALNMHTRFMLSINKQAAAPLFALSPNDEFLGYMPIWYDNAMRSTNQ